MGQRLTPLDEFVQHQQKKKRKKKDSFSCSSELFGCKFWPFVHDIHRILASLEHHSYLGFCCSHTSSSYLQYSGPFTGAVLKCRPKLLDPCHTPRLAPGRSSWSSAELIYRTSHGTETRTDDWKVGPCERSSISNIEWNSDTWIVSILSSNIAPRVSAAENSPFLPLRGLSLLAVYARRLSPSWRGTETKSARHGACTDEESGSLLVQHFVL